MAAALRAYSHRFALASGLLFASSIDFDQRLRTEPI